MEFSNKDFNADKVQQHEEVRKEMARKYEHQPSYFGLESLNSGVSSDELKIRKDLIKKAYQRLHEKNQRIETKLPKYIQLVEQVTVQKLVTNMRIC